MGVPRVGVGLFMGANKYQIKAENSIALTIFQFFGRAFSEFGRGLCPQAPSLCEPMSVGRSPNEFQNSLTCAFG